MVLNGDTQKQLAKKTGITSATMSRKFNKLREWDATEIKAIANVYNLTPEQIYEIFFAD